MSNAKNGATIKGVPHFSYHTSQDELLANGSDDVSEHHPIQLVGYH